MSHELDVDKSNGKLLILKHYDNLLDAMTQCIQ